MTERADIQEELLRHAERQTKALEGIYLIAIGFALLAGVGVLVWLAALAGILG
jgi:hypothetical protein